MDIEIIIKGGTELSELCPKKYDVLEEKIGQMFLKTFPSVGCCLVIPELTTIGEKRRKKEQEERKQILKDILMEPEIQELIRSQMPVVNPECVKSFNL